MASFFSTFLIAPGSNSKYAQPNAAPAGFWAGLWHGLIVPLTFLVSLFDPGVRVYETRNNGRWYDFGFVLGVSIAFGGGGRELPPH